MAGIDVDGLICIRKLLLLVSITRSDEHLNILARLYPECMTRMTNFVKRLAVYEVCI